MSATALLFADAGPEDGLGHLSRLSAVAVALRCRGFQVHCHANGASVPLERDAVAWAPWSPGDRLPSGVDVVILDSYRMEPDRVVPPTVPFVVFDDGGDRGDTPTAPSLVVSVAGSPSDHPPRLGGPRYAALRPAYWGLPPKSSAGGVRRVLVTTGGGDPDGLGVEVARAVAAELPDASVRLVRGPHTPATEAHGIRPIESPESLVEEQLAADLVVCGGGQTMLETAACGTPCIALTLAENQREQALTLASSGAVVLVDPGDVRGAIAAVRGLDAAARLELSRRAQHTVDGYGALRIAYHVEAVRREAI